MGKIIGILIVCLILWGLTALSSERVYVYEDAFVTHYRHKSFDRASVTTVKFPDGEIRSCRHLLYRDKGDKVIARKSGKKHWALEK